VIVSLSEFQDVLQRFKKPGAYALDTETTGLKWYANDKLFSIILADEADAYYFNFNEEPDHLGNWPDYEYRLPRRFLSFFNDILEIKDSLWFMHNAKFDKGMLAREGLRLAGTIHCTEAMARLINSNFKNYSFGECLKRMALELGHPTPQKDDIAKKYVQKHKLFTNVRVRGKEKPIKEVYYHKIPFDIITTYGLQDGKAELALGNQQRLWLGGMVQQIQKAGDCITEERKLTKTLFQMDTTGMGIDVPYVEQCLSSELETVKAVEKEYLALTGEAFIDSNIKFAAAFDALGLSYPRTEKGNPSFAKDALDEVDNPIANVIKDRRAAAKRASSYYSSFLYYEHNGRIHANSRQGGAATGRMSYREPALQTIPKIDEDKLGSEKVRRCFIPDPDFCLFMPDYDQMEYRMMLDAAGETNIIDLILGGLDVHTATAEMMGVSRKAAKTINFMLLYGGGAAKLAEALGISEAEAKSLKRLYFERLPNVRTWINMIQYRAKKQGYIVNWAGRRCTIDRGFEYKAPNYYIQGGCADVVKKAMNVIDNRLVGKSKMLLQVHDELIFNIHKDEFKICPQIVSIMQTIYPHKTLPLTVGAKHSWKSWGDPVSGYPKEQAG